MVYNGMDSEYVYLRDKQKKLITGMDELAFTVMGLKRKKIIWRQ